MPTLAKIAADNYNVNKAIYDPNEVYKNRYAVNSIQGGNALAFANSQYVSYDTITLTGEFSVSFWIKFNNGTSQYGIITENIINAGFIARPGFGRYQLAFNGGGNYNFAGFTITPNTWYHVFCRRNSLNEVYYYQNGIASINNGQVAAGTLNLTRLHTISDGDFKDEIAIWNTDIGDKSSILYNNNDGIYAGSFYPNNLKAYWRFNQNTGDSILIDETGNFNGTLLNGFDVNTCWALH